MTITVHCYGPTCAAVLSIETDSPWPAQAMADALNMNRWRMLRDNDGKPHPACGRCTA